MEKRNIKFYIVILLISAIIVFCVAIIFGSKKENVEIPSDKQKVATVPPKESDRIEIKTSGGIVSVKNPYKNAVESLPQGGVAFKVSADYYMAYYPEDQGFIITLADPDLKTALQKAGGDFLKSLDINREQACLLKVSVTVPFSVSEKFAGGIYSLSFCNTNPF